MREKRKEKRQTGNSKLHIIYLCIIFGMITLGLVAFIFYNIDEAWVFLSFSGVSLSIVLAVIAIVITLVDVAGQKHQVFEIAKSVEEFREVSEKQNDFVNNFQEEVDNFNDAQKEYSETLERITMNNERKLNNFLEELPKVIKEMEQNNYKSNSENKISNSNDENTSNNISDVEDYFRSPFYKSFLRYKLERPLTPEEESDIIDIVSRYGNIKIRFDDSEFELVYFVFNFSITPPDKNRRLKRLIHLDIDEYLANQNINKEVQWLDTQ